LLSIWLLLVAVQGVALLLRKLLAVAAVLVAYLRDMRELHLEPLTR
jgi:hypothetical protein